MGCGRHFCPKCGEEFIHRDNRKGYESASCLGQIVWREGPLRLSVTDIDLLTRKGLPGGHELLRVNEQKQPGHKFTDTQQERTLKLLDNIIAHCGLCPSATELKVDPRSGVYIVRGMLGAATDGRRRTAFMGPQEIERLHTGQKWVAQTHEDFFHFLDPEDSARRKRDEDRESGSLKAVA